MHKYSRYTRGRLAREGCSPPLLSSLSLSLFLATNSRRMYTDDTRFAAPPLQSWFMHLSRDHPRRILRPPPPPSPLTPRDKREVKSRERRGQFDLSKEDLPSALSLPIGWPPIARFVTIAPPFSRPSQFSRSFRTTSPSIAFRYRTTWPGFLEKSRDDPLNVASNLGREFHGVHYIYATPSLLISALRLIVACRHCRCYSHEMSIKTQTPMKI